MSILQGRPAVNAAGVVLAGRASSSFRGAPLMSASSHERRPGLVLRSRPVVRVLAKNKDTTPGAPAGGDDQRSAAAAAAREYAMKVLANQRATVGTSPRKASDSEATLEIAQGARERELAIVQRDKRVLRAELEVKKADMAELKGELALTKRALRTEKRKRLEAEEALKVRSKEVLGLKSRLTEASTNLRVKDDQLASAYDQLANAARERTSLRAELSSLQGELEGARTELQRWAGDLSELKTLMDGVNDSVGDGKGAGKGAVAPRGVPSAPLAATGKASVQNQAVSTLKDIVELSRTVMKEASADNLNNGIDGNGRGQAPPDKAAEEADKPEEANTGAEENGDAKKDDTKIDWLGGIGRMVLDDKKQRAVSAGQKKAFNALLDLGREVGNQTRKKDKK